MFLIYFSHCNYNYFEYSGDVKKCKIGVRACVSAHRSKNYCIYKNKFKKNLAKINENTVM